MTTELAAGAVVAGFRVESLVGHGAMAKVYRARDEAHDRVVALKMLDDALARDERFRQRFLRESQLAASLDHPHIVRTLALRRGRRAALPRDGAASTAPTCASCSARTAALDPERAVDARRAGGRCARRRARGRARPSRRQARQHPRRRRARGEHAYICDFGLARHVVVREQPDRRPRLRRHDRLRPARADRRRHDRRAAPTSTHSVASSTSASPGSARSSATRELSVVFAHLNEPPPRLTDVRPELPAAFDEVFATALAKAPDDRYSSCGELAAAARAALRGRCSRGASRGAGCSWRRWPCCSPQPPRRPGCC